MLRKNSKLIITGFVVTMIVGIFAGSVSLYAKETKQQAEPTKLDSYIKFTQIINLIENQYVDEVNTSGLVTKALKGLMSNLDAHSAYMDAKSFSDLDIQTKGEFGGLGIVVGMKNGALTVISPIDDTPAYKAGLKAEDIILKINDKSTLGMTIDEAVKLMRGKVDTPIKLTIIRKKSPKPIIVKIIRGIIKIESVKVKTIGDDILYVRITSFDAKVTTDLKKALLSHKNAKGLILDLRNNPGGLLNQAVGVLDMFIDKGVLVSQKGRHEKDNSEFRATKKNTINSSMPIVTLVNGGSASASEIVSGGLQDTGRSIIVGKKTFGKGSVQVVIPIGKKEGIKLTIARYYLPSGRTIQNKGVTPDIMIEPGVVKQEDNNTISLKETDLKKHLKDELVKLGDKVAKDGNLTKDENATKEEEKTIITKTKLYKDAQLKSATDILKALIIADKTRK